MAQSISLSNLATRHPWGSVRCANARPSRVSTEAVPLMDELDNAAILEPMIISAPEELGTSSGETCVELNDSSVRMAAGGFYEADKENEEDQRCGSTQRSSASEPLAMDIKSGNEPSDGDTQSILGDTAPACDKAVSTASQLTEAFVLKRTAELFPGGTTAPAAKPRWPPIVEKPTGQLATLAFAASKGVQLTRGKLAREEAAAYITADFLGIELLHEEALKLGESVRKAAQSVEDRVTAKQKAATAKRSRLRRDAAKDAGRAAHLDQELQQLETETEAACADIRRNEIKLNGLPDANTRIVVHHVPEPEPVDRRQLALETMLGSQVAMTAIDAADDCERAERDLLEAEWGHCDEFGEPLDKETIEEELELAHLRYKHALRRLKAAFPDVLNDCSPEGVCQHRRPCPCGQGQRGAWPWVIQTAARGFCEITAQQRGEFTPRGLCSCYELDYERERWRWATAWSDEGAEERRAMRMPDGTRRMTEEHYHETMEAIRRGSCAVRIFRDCARSHA